jgi:hypothetical protein
MTERVPMLGGGSVHVEFTDRTGRRGIVTAELTVEYDGPWADEIEDAVFDITTEYDAAHDEYDPEDLFLEMLVLLPELSAIDTVEFAAESEPSSVEA